MSHCVARGPDGTACTDDGECLSASCYKLSTTGTPRCGRPSLGERCLAGLLTNPCATGQFCLSSSTNDAGQSTDPFGKCAPAVTDGGPCTHFPYGNDCATEGSSCLGGKCVINRPGTLAAGSECDDHFQCRTGLFCNGLTYGASSSGTCTPWLKAGDPCDLKLGNAGCAQSARCRNGICVELSDVSGACQQPLDCRLLLGCRTDGGCVAPAPPGGSCTALPGCTGASYCTAVGFFDTGSCTPYLSAGQHCSATRAFVIAAACQSQACFPASDGGDFGECVDCLNPY